VVLGAPGTDVGDVDTGARVVVGPELPPSSQPPSASASAPTPAAEAITRALPDRIDGP
jgi:hypothetical protein